MKLFGARSSPATVGLFGKLPSYGDFMSMHADSPEAQALAKWLQEGVGQAGVQIGGDQFVHFIWEPAGSRARTVVGILWPSADSAGRRFPFCLFSSVPGAALASLDALKVIAVEPLWRQMHELYAQLHSLGELNAQYGLLQDAQPSEVLDEAAASQAYEDRARATTLQGAKRIAVALHLRDLVQFGNSVANAGGDLAFALRMRLHGRLDPDLEAATWLRVIRNRIGRQALGSSLFVQMNRGDGTQAATVYRRPLQPSDLPGLFCPPTQSRSLDTVGYRTAMTTDDDVLFREAFDRRWASRPSVYATLLDVGLMSWAAEDMAAPPPAVGSGPPTVADTGDDAITGEVILDTVPEVATAAATVEAAPPTESQSPTAPAAVTVAEDDRDAITGEIVMEPVAASEESPAEEAAAADGEEPPGDAPQPEAEASDGAATVGAVAGDGPAEGGEPTSAADLEPPPAAEPLPEAERTEVEPAEVEPAEVAPAEIEPGDLETGEAAPRQTKVARLVELASGPLRSGRIVRVGPSDGVRDDAGLVVYVAEGASRGEALPADPDAADEIRRQIENYGEAKRLLTELGNARADAASSGDEPATAEAQSEETEHNA